MNGTDQFAEEEGRRYAALMQAMGRADDASQARMLNGETPAAYRIRLASKLQHLDAEWKGANLLITARADSTLFNNALRSIYDSAERTLQRDPAALGCGRGVLRAVESFNDHGQKFTRFYGDQMVWMAPFMGGIAKFGRINRTPAVPNSSTAP